MATLQWVGKKPRVGRLACGRLPNGGYAATPYFVAGQVTIVGIPAARKVRLYRLNNGTLAQETWSNAQGAYRFDDVEAGEYYVWSEDFQRQYDPVSHLVPLQRA
jgi:hypothetical protein